jgi:hypothetical protein
MVVHKLQKLNIASAALQGVLCVTMIILLLRDEIQNQTWVPDPSVVEAQGDEDGDLPPVGGRGPVPFRTLTWALVVFTGLTACAHAFYAANTDVYTRAVDTGNNWVRWIEYAATATIMLVVIAVISGVEGADSLILIAAATIGTMVLGQTVESAANNRSTMYTATCVGWLLLGSAYGIIFKNFHTLAQLSKATGSAGPPDFVYAIVFTMFGLFASFGVLQLVRTVLPTAIHKTVHYNRQTEVLYSVNSMISKTLLVGLVLSGVVGGGGGGGGGSSETRTR